LDLILEVFSNLNDSMNEKNEKDVHRGLPGSF